MKDIKISVIVPVYNVENFLRECLDSLLTQTDSDDIEVICVNDGSTDKSGDILQEYKSKYPRMRVITQSNKGLSAARNAGMAEMSGRYVYFLDSDDYLVPGAIQSMLDFATEKDVEVACFNVQFSDNSGRYYFKRGFSIDKCSGSDFLKSFYQNVGRYYSTPVWMYLYRTDFIVRNHLTFAPGRLHEDNLFTGKALYQAQSIALENIPVQIHRVNREGSITASINERHYKSRVLNFRELYGFYMGNKIKAPFIEALICQFLSLLTDIMRADIPIKKSGLSVFDLLKFVSISPFYISVLCRRLHRRFFR